MPTTRPVWKLDLGSEEATPRAQAIWALASVLVITVVLGTMGVLYLRPPGYATYHLELPESGGLSVGDGVRIAGVPVGRIMALHLEDDHVDVEFTVDSNQRLGDQTSVSVRMLSPVGGLYLAVLPDGSKPLRANIPAQRATLPFQVEDLVHAADTVVADIDVAALRAALTGTAAALADSPEAIRNSVSELESVVTVFAEQKNQINDLLSVSNEYLQAVHNNQALATEVIRAYAVLGPRIVDAREKVENFSDKISALVGLLFDFLSGPYAQKVEPLLAPLEQSSDLSKELLNSVDSVMTSLSTTVTSLSGLAGPEGQALIDQSGLTVRRPDVCLPVPGIRC
ncbi:MlaD family protein [Nocardia sp. NPDC005366]|uniref:MlaD family protein n=1 Tax=Nocardia sp. NPDC005366 TaxID=3156878 RepID=UPI0033ADED30